MAHFSLICCSFLILKRQIQGLFWKPQLPAQSRPELTPLLFLLYFIINLIIYPRVGRREKIGGQNLADTPISQAQEGEKAHPLKKSERKSGGRSFPIPKEIELK